MTPLETLEEMSRSNATLKTLHPQKLDRWYQSLFQLPHAIYMQMGCGELFEQLSLAGKSILQVQSLMGSLPLEIPELAQRAVGKFSWHIQAEGRQELGTVRFTVHWQPSEEKWVLKPHVLPKERLVASLEEAYDHSLKMAQEYLEKLAEDLQEKQGEA